MSALRSQRCLSQEDGGVRQKKEPPSQHGCVSRRGTKWIEPQILSLEDRRNSSWGSPVCLGRGEVCKEK